MITWEDRLSLMKVITQEGTAVRSYDPEIINDSYPAGEELIEGCAGVLINGKIQRYRRKHIKTKWNRILNYEMGQQAPGDDTFNSHIEILGLSNTYDPEVFVVFYTKRAGGYYLFAMACRIGKEGNITWGAEKNLNSDGVTSDPNYGSAITQVAAKWSGYNNAVVIAYLRNSGTFNTVGIGVNTDTLAIDVRKLKVLISSIQGSWGDGLLHQHSDQFSIAFRYSTGVKKIRFSYAGAPDHEFSLLEESNATDAVYGSGSKSNLVTADTRYNTNGYVYGGYYSFVMNNSGDGGPNPYFGTMAAHTSGMPTKNFIPAEGNYSQHYAFMSKGYDHILALGVSYSTGTFSTVKCRSSSPSAATFGPIENDYMGLRDFTGDSCPSVQPKDDTVTLFKGPYISCFHRDENEEFRVIPKVYRQEVSLPEGDFSYPVSRLWKRPIVVNGFYLVPYTISQAVSGGGNKQINDVLLVVPHLDDFTPVGEKVIENGMIAGVVIETAQMDYPCKLQVSGKITGVAEVGDVWYVGEDGFIVREINSYPILHAQQKNRLTIINYNERRD